jgi:peptidoglycan/xylan/chitin deacetylase (PgdA/CDA1 family)
MATDILMIHDIVASEDRTRTSPWKSAISRSEFETFLKNRHADDMSSLLTFDDGYASFISIALPLLREHKAKACVFIATSFMDGSREPYEDALWKHINGSDKVDACGLGVFPCKRTTEKLVAYERIRLHLKTLSLSQRDAWMISLAGHPQPQNPADMLFLTAEEVQHLASEQLITIGSHAESHTTLTSLSLTDAILEMRHSKARLEAVTGRSITDISYPYGASNLAIRIAGFLIGYRRGFLASRNRPRTAWLTPNMAIPRADIRNVVPGIR